MKKSLIILAVLIFLPFVSAVIQVQKVDKGSVLISELNNPAVFDFTVDNIGSPDTFEIYSLIGVTMYPKGFFILPTGKSTFEVMAYPNKEIRSRPGFFTFEYEIKGKSSGIFKDKITIKIVPLKDAIEVKTQPLKPSSSEIVLLVKNAENTNLYNLAIKFKSEFFETEQIVSLKPYETANITIPLNKEKISRLVAGAYVMTADVNFEGAKTRIEGIIDYLEEEGISVRESSSGFVVHKNTVTKTNVGNTNVIAKVESRKDILTRLFTTYSSEPLTSDRKGLFVMYSWEKSLSPGDSLTVTTSTNYTFPFILIILIVSVVLFAKIYSQTALVVSKRVSFVKTKGGEFALKVNLHVSAKKHVDSVQLIDRLPGMTKLYEKFGRAPDKIDHATRRLFWNVGSLNAGEERVFSYVIYSTLRAVGNYELPAATAVFEREGKTHEVLSNKTFFASETAKGEM